MWPLNCSHHVFKGISPDHNRGNHGVKCELKGDRK
jgi:hypothetical protein